MTDQPCATCAAVSHHPNLRCEDHPFPTPIRGDDYPEGMCGYCGWGVFHDQPGNPPGSECPGRQT